MADQLLTGTTLVENVRESNGDVPIGGVVAWLSNLTGVPNLPIGWMLCDGSTVADNLSPMNGTVVPDLNGDNRFLRGDDTAGGTGGSETHTHSTDIAEQTVIGTGTGYAATDFNPTTGATSTLPTYYAVVWIIRVR